MTEAEKQRLRAESRARAREAANLAAAGKYRCRFCKREKPLAEGIVVMWGGSILFSLCPECYPGRPIIMEHREMLDGNKGVYVGFLRESDRPSDLLVVPSMGSAEHVAGQALAKREKLDFGE
jgi:hypothetical protein